MGPDRTGAARPARRRGATLVGLVLAAALVVACTAPPAPRSALRAPGSRPAVAAARRRRPSIVFVLTDDLDLGELSALPGVRRLLGGGGVTFSDYLVTNTICCPSRTTTLRGQYAHNTHVETNVAANGGFETAHARGLERSMLGSWLQRVGYRTAFVGKYLNGYPAAESAYYVPPGWDLWASAVAGDPYSEYDYTLDVDGRLVAHGHRPADYGTRVSTGLATGFIRSTPASQPFYLQLNLYAPHQPATPAPPDRAAFPHARAPRGPAFDERDVSDKPGWVRALPRLGPGTQRRIDALYRQRLRSLRAVDRSVALLVRTLREAGRLDDTYVVFASDNGFHLGQHRLPRGKVTAYETDVHVPLLVRGPGVPAGRTVGALVANHDLAPTFADLAGAAVPRFVDGRSFAPLLHHPSASVPWRQAVAVEHWTERPEGTLFPRHVGPTEPGENHRRPSSGPPYPLRRPRFAATGPNEIPRYHGVRTARYTYVEYATGERELYDLAADPDQLRNLASTAPAPLLRELHHAVRRLRSCRGAGCRAAEDAPVPG